MQYSIPSIDLIILQLLRGGVLLEVKSWREPQEMEIDRLPDECPICHAKIQPIMTESSFLTASGLNPELEIVFRCPAQTCGRFFIGRYSRSAYDHYGSKVSLSHCEPWSLRDVQFDERILEISPDFVAIYNEAQKAEQMRLPLACGPAFRKSLEFLIKDYVIRLHPEEAEAAEIKRMQLAPCIQRYVEDPKVKSSAKRAVWLGNDETHYQRKWQGKELEDLKALIQLTLYWIQSEELTRQTLEDMPEL